MKQVLRARLLNEKNIDCNENKLYRPDFYKEWP